MNPIPLVPCDCCNGSGQIYDHAAIGKHMQKVRTDAGLSLREVARRLGLSAPYVGDLERGYRYWSKTRIKDYEHACSPAYEPKEPFTL